MDESAFRLQTGHGGIEIPPVDAFHFQGDRLTDYFGDMMRYHGDGLRLLFLTHKVRSLGDPTPARAEPANNTTPRLVGLRRNLVTLYSRSVPFSASVFKILPVVSNSSSRTSLPSLISIS